MVGVTKGARSILGPVLLGTGARRRELGLLFAVVVVAIVPGLLLGAAAAFALWQRQRPQPSTRWATAVLAGCVALYAMPAILWAWPLRLLSPAPPSGSSILTSILAEALFGPLALQAALTTEERRRAVPAPVAAGAPTVAPAPGASAASTAPPPAAAPRETIDPASRAHPPGHIRLGIDHTGHPYDLELPKELGLHVFIPGLFGWGKTTTLTRLADGALANGYGVIIVDGKGGGLGTSAKKLARIHGRKLFMFSLDEPDSLGYNPCTGDPASVSNKIIGSFTFGGESEFYKNIASSIVPPIVSAMQAVGEKVTIDSLWRALKVGGNEENAIKKLASRVGNVAVRDGAKDTALLELKDELTEIATRQGAFAAGRDGLRDRLGAFRNGTFGPLLRKEPAISWDEIMAEPSVAYLELPTLKSSQDVDLLARIVTEDLKQITGRRIQAVAAAEEEKREKAVRFLVIFDEFAAFNAVDQMQDFLLQGRAALMSLVISTQFVPEAIALRTATLGAGLVLVHRVATHDAVVLADQLGMRDTVDVSVSSNIEKGEPQSTNTRQTQAFNVTPDELREFELGEVAVRSTTRDPAVANRRAKIRVYREIGVR